VALLLKTKQNFFSKSLIAMFLCGNRKLNSDKIRSISVLFSQKQKEKNTTARIVSVK
jgi:hypothetical protein